MKSLLPDVLLLVGLVLLPLGVALVHTPAGIAVLGLECFVLGAKMSRR